MFDNRARAIQVAFTTRRGQEVMARLDLPRGRLRSYALFAHCLGPKGDAAAEAFVAGLLEYGLGVLSFELTAPQAPPAVGEEGASTATGSADAPPLALDTQDIVDGASVLRLSHGAPELLVGHSLAGAAVLRAATELHEVRAVATVGAPSDFTHMQHLLEDDLPAAEASGEARLWIADRFCRLRATFLDELDETEMRSVLLDLKRPLLVTHSPVDNVIGIENARRIYDAARHPKSFVSLAGADHEFTRPLQAHVAGELVGAWTATVLPPDPELPDEWREDGVAYARTGPVIRTEASAGGFPLVLDEAMAIGGTDAGPDPYDLLCTALAGSISMSLRKRADAEKWPLEEVTTRVVYRELAATADPTAPTDGFDVLVRLVGSALTEQQRAALLAAVPEAPMHDTLRRTSEITARLA
ncbi:MAG: OsmC family protein [Trueperaceae bacterium]